MTPTSDAAISFANKPRHNMGPPLYQSGSTNFAIINKIKEMYADQTVPTLAAWIKVTIKTAKNRLLGQREFTLDEVERLLHSDQGFEILSALMTRAPRKPQWWLVCEPLMEFASIEQMRIIVQDRVAQAVQKAAQTNEALALQLRSAQAAAIRDPEFHQPHVDALRSYAVAVRRVVATKKR